MEKVVKEVDDLLDEMGELPDKTEENKKRLAEIEKKLGLTKNP